MKEQIEAEYAARREKIAREYYLTNKQKEDLGIAPPPPKSASDTEIGRDKNGVPLAHKLKINAPFTQLPHQWRRS